VSILYPDRLGPAGIKSTELRLRAAQFMYNVHGGSRRPSPNVVGPFLKRTSYTVEGDGCPLSAGPRPLSKLFTILFSNEGFVSSIFNYMTTGYSDNKIFGAILLHETNRYEI
jgi:hypothetical protein